MGFRINTNISSLSAQRSLSKSNRETENTLAKMSSGTRITKAADDAAGLAIRPIEMPMMVFQWCKQLKEDSMRFQIS